MQLEATALAQTGARQRQFVQVIGDPGGVRVFAVVRPAIQIHVFGPTEQVLQAHHQQPAITGTFIDPRGTFASAFLFTGWRGQRLFGFIAQIGCLRAGEILRRVQPQRQRPGCAFATRKMLDTARLTQRLA
ncbi:hypothetical protein D3C84_729100 [compost metagenome]